LKREVPLKGSTCPPEYTVPHHRRRLSSF